MAMTESTPAVQAQRKTKVGRVVSDKMDKTIVVSVERLTRHRLYKRVIRLTTKFKAHDEDNDAHVGDTVRIEESRPLSATKRWRLVEVVQRAGDHGAAADLELVSEGAEVSEAIHAAAHPGRVRHDADAAEAADAAKEAANAVDADAVAVDAADADAPAAATEPATNDAPEAEAEEAAPEAAAKDDKQ
jgi:small subunit ribosomal protein S17